MNPNRTYLIAGNGGWERQSRLYRNWETYIGTPDAIDALRQSLPVGSVVTGKGTVNSHRYGIDRAANLPTLTVNYQTRYDSSGNPVNPSTSRSPDTHSLDGRVIQRQIETKMDRQGNLVYRTNWNHYLIGLGEWADTVPPEWAIVTDTYISNAGAGFPVYKWIKQSTEIPLTPYMGRYWNICKQGDVVCIPQKPGVEVYDWAVYTIIETGHHSTESQALWATAAVLNSISAPMMGDFGLSSLVDGDWKVDSCSIREENGLFVAERTYTLSGDFLGWDKDLYGTT